MSTALAILHFIGTKPLTASFAAQIAVLCVAIKTKDKTQVWQCLILLVALALLIISIGLRKSSPINLTADVLGAIAAVLFLDPGVRALLTLRKKPGPATED